MNISSSVLKIERITVNFCPHKIILIPSSAFWELGWEGYAKDKPEIKMSNSVEKLFNIRNLGVNSESCSVKTEVS